MSWLYDKSVVTYQNLYDRTYGYGGSTYTLNSGQTITPSNECIKISEAEAILNLDSNYIPSGISSNREAIREWLVPGAFNSGITGVITIDFYIDNGYNLVGYCDTSGVDSFINNQIVYTGNNFFMNSATTPDNCWFLASDYHTPGSPYWRFEFNVKKFLVVYENIDVFNFFVRGNSNSNAATNGAYVLHSANESTMTMTGSVGSYLPSVSGGTLQGLTTFSSNITSGATGSYSISTGQPIIQIIYNRLTSSVSAITY